VPRFTGTGDGPLDPDRSAGRLFVDGYGDGGFRIAGRSYAGSVIILPDRVLAWAVTAFAEISVASLSAILERADGTDLLLLGMGPQMQPLPADVRHACHGAGITVEPMDTGAAARTYNVLLAEDRHVSAALIAV
jgi:uncharacterized protein